MTKRAPAEAGVGAREAGRQLGVSHSYLLKLAKQGRLPRNADGTFNVEACRRWLAANTDPSQVRAADPDRWSRRGDRSTQSVTGNHPSSASSPASTKGAWRIAIESAEHVAEPFEKGVVVAVVMLAHRVGAAMACLAADEGAPLEVAYGFQDAATLGFMELGEDLLRQLPSFASVPVGAELPVRYEPPSFDRVAWDAVARDRGETADVPAWQTQVRERRERAAA